MDSTCHRGEAELRGAQRVPRGQNIAVLGGGAYPYAIGKNLSRHAHLAGVRAVVQYPTAAPSFRGSVAPCSVPCC